MDDARRSTTRRSRADRERRERHPRRSPEHNDRDGGKRTGAKIEPPSHQVGPGERALRSASVRECRLNRGIRSRQVSVRARSSPRVLILRRSPVRSNRPLAECIDQWLLEAVFQLASFRPVVHDLSRWRPRGVSVIAPRKRRPCRKPADSSGEREAGSLLGRDPDGRPPGSGTQVRATHRKYARASRRGRTEVGIAQPSAPRSRTRRGPAARVDVCRRLCADAPTRSRPREHQWKPSWADPQVTLACTEPFRRASSTASTMRHVPRRPTLLAREVSPRSPSVEISSAHPRLWPPGLLVVPVECRPRTFPRSTARADMMRRATTEHGSQARTVVSASAARRLRGLAHRGARTFRLGGQAFPTRLVGDAIEGDDRLELFQALTRTCAGSSRT